MSIKSQIKQLGLSHKESTIYLTLLKIGNATVPKIAKYADIPTSTVRDTLKTLSEKGLVSKYKTGSKNHYSPTEPRLLKEKVMRQVDVVNDLVPKLNAMYHPLLKETTVRYFDHRSGFDVLFKEIANEAKDLLAIGSADVEEFLPEYFPELTKVRLKHSIPAKLILPNSEYARAVQKDDTKQLRKTKILKKTTKIPATMFIWKNKLAVFSVGDNPSVLLLEDSNMTQVFKIMFETIWESLE